LLFTAAALMGGGKKEEADPPFYRDRNGPAPAAPERPALADLPLVRVSGRVRLVGSGMSLEYVITGADGEWYIEKQAQDRFRDLQQRTVTAEGRLEREELALLNGQKIARLTLREVSIIEIE
jgi:hypothetical protein